MMLATKLIKKLLNLPKFLEEKDSHTPGKWGNVTLIPPMSYKPQYFIDNFIQCLIHKYQVAYQNIWGKGMIRPQFSGTGLLSNSGVTERCAKFSHFLHKKDF